MKKPLYDVIVGNIAGATNPTPAQPASVVQTRSPITETKNSRKELAHRQSYDFLTLVSRSSSRLTSHLGVGAVLLQEDTAGEKRPIAFASQKLLPRESRYSTIGRECLAITWGVKKFQEYLYGTEFILETDHQPLQYLRQAKLQNGRLMRWALALQTYGFLLRDIRGRDNVEADCLSRNPLED